jgi:hypothetical protein
MRLGFELAVLAVGLGAGLLWLEPARAIDGPLPDELHGRYAPAGNCGREPRVVADASGILIEADGRISRVEPLDVCFSCAGGARYEGIEIWVGQKLGNEIVAVFRFNADEQPGALIAMDQGYGRVGAEIAAVIAASPLERCAPP